MNPAEQTLKSSLLAIKHDLPDYIDGDMLDGAITSCASLPDAEVQQFMGNFFGDIPSLQGVIQQYLRQRTSSSGGAGPAFPASTPPTQLGLADAGDPRGAVHAYMKPKLEEPPQSRDPQRKASRPGEGSQPGSGTAPVEQEARSGRGGKKGRARRVVDLAELDKGLVIFKQGVPCDCQASKHGLVNNCLGCGKIVCEQEGEGPCYFCGRLVAREGSELALMEEQAGLGAANNSNAPISLHEEEAQARAVAFKDRLVEYDKTSAQRTAVIDDQSDYFEIDGDGWLTEEERKILRKREEEKRQREEDRRRKVVVTFDLIGRKVMMEDPGSGSYIGSSGEAPGFSFDSNSSTSGPTSSIGSTELGNSTVALAAGSIAQGAAGAESSSGGRQEASGHGAAPDSLRNPFGGGSLPSQGLFSLGDDLPMGPLAMTPSPNLRVAAPTFVGDMKALKSKQGGSGREQGQGSAAANESAAAVGRSVKQAPRVQYDTSLGASLGRALGTVANSDAVLASSNEHQEAQSTKGPQAQSRPTPASDPSIREADGGAFDICPGADSGGPAQLLRTGLGGLGASSSSSSASLGLIRPGSAVVLQEGMVLLKGWLPLEQQAQTVQLCRRLGLGPGGFYTPKMSNGAEMRIRMMCMGKHWEPNLKAYEERRTFHDNAAPPPIPEELTALVQQALEAAQKLPRAGLPTMSPQVCIANWYSQGSTLGMHQDKDEASASIRRGCPVVSFSIGDSAVFQFGRERMSDTAQRLVLESGDVLLFGGASRLIFHGVPQVMVNSAPRELVEATGLRPGRLNLTFREL